MTSLHRFISIGLIWFAFTIVGFFTVNSIFISETAKLQLTMITAVACVVATLIAATVKHANLTR